ncbi:MAG: hypothetical protein CUN49_03205 [Candidatus Thermofonsia Clade 1 bacterium]|jgi:hypothetical protein|uniref:SH3b domain-containing protein n=1 Tax=Candidatus Thermofonsia Clade 1 bacterium TaxID=2364210 RepID=A0A2M8PH63_9CHLR|nr:MAG: hypothetical protein CUN49_03205 [Candidatus Thermofonsia Clade 1 bacterium]RMF53368.1 MAG: SH3 domain-containing protein [Chloroflexota bacterium]
MIALAKRLRTLSLIGVAMLMVIACLGESAQAQTSVVGTVIVDELYMRSAASRNSAILDTLRFGQRVEISGRSTIRGWGYGRSEAGAVGWVVLQYLEFPANANLSELPIVPPDAPTNPAGGAAAPAAGGDTGGATPVPAAPPPPAASGANLRGFELGGQVQSLSPATVNAMRRAGMTWVKRQAKEGDGAAFAYISEAKANGFKILLSVIGNIDLVVEPSYQDVYANFVGQLAAAGADAIEVWNEQNIDREWKRGAISPVTYTQLLAKAYNAIKANNPNTLVISGAPAPTGAEAAFGSDRVWNDDRYAQGMAAAGAGRYADCIGLHYNEGIISPNQRSGDPRGDNYPTRYFDGQIARGLNPFGGKRGCFTELGYLSPQGYGPLPGNFAWAANVTVQQQAQWLAEAAVRAAQSGRIRLLIVFNVDFTYYGADDPQAGYAMIRPDGSCPACETLGRVMGAR